MPLCRLLHPGQKIRNPSPVRTGAYSPPRCLRQPERSRAAVVCLCMRCRQVCVAREPSVAPVRNPVCSNVQQERKPCHLQLSEEIFLFISMLWPFFRGSAEIDGTAGTQSICILQIRMHSVTDAAAEICQNRKPACYSFVVRRAARGRTRRTEPGSRTGLTRQVYRKP